MATNDTGRQVASGTGLAGPVEGAPSPAGGLDAEQVCVAFCSHHVNPGHWPDTIRSAFTTAAVAHAGQLRRSGDPYVSHPLAVAQIVADFGADGPSLVAALLHDTVEDTSVTLADISEQYGSEVASLVDGLTKLDKLHFSNDEEAQAASLRKMIVALAKDLRVIVVKLADRLHNMQTIDAMPGHRALAISRETLDVYAPLAQRLGMHSLAAELEDLAFATLYPARYTELMSIVATRAESTDAYLHGCVDEVERFLAADEIVADVTIRRKHLWSVYQKMASQAKTFDQIYDYVGLRILVGSVKDCYAALGSVHAMWPPVPGRFKDFIASPGTVVAIL